MLNIAIVILEVCGAVISFHTHGTGMFRFYTEDSNILSLIASAVLAVSIIASGSLGKSASGHPAGVPGWVQVLKYVSVCCLMVTFLVVLTVLAPGVGKGGFKQMFTYGSMLYNHLLCPLLALVSFIFFDSKNMLSGKDVWHALAPTMLYAVVIFILNILKVLKGPYPFLYVYEQPVMVSVMWVFIILGIALLVAWAVNKAGTRKNYL